MGVERFGDWEKVKATLNSSLGARLTMAIRKATYKNALLLVRQIQKGIKSQAPGGHPFVKLADSTIEGRKGNSTKALIDTGFLINAITQKIMGDSAFVGLLRTTIRPGGENMANIGAIMEYGATIQHPNGATIIIPPRPFLHPVMEEFKDQVMQNYRDAVSEVI